MKWLGLAAAVAGLALARPSAASTTLIYTGSFNGTDLDWSGDFYSLPASAYQVTMTVDAPIQGSPVVTAALYETLSLHAFIYGKGEFVDGDDGPDDPIAVPFTTTADTLAFTYHVPRPDYYRGPWQIGSQTTTLWGVQSYQLFILSVGGFLLTDAPTTPYSVSVTFLPESDVWLLMVLGLGATGWTMRRRRRQWQRLDGEPVSLNVSPVKPLPMVAPR